MFSPHKEPRPLAARLNAMRGLSFSWGGQNKNVTFHVSLVKGEDPSRTLGFMSKFGGNFDTVLLTMDRMYPVSRCIKYGSITKNSDTNGPVLLNPPTGWFKNTHMYIHILRNFDTEFLLHFDSDVIAVSALLPGWITTAKRLLRNGAAVVQMAKCLRADGISLSLRVYGSEEQHCSVVSFVRTQTPRGGHF